MVRIGFLFCLIFSSKIKRVNRLLYSFFLFLKFILFYTKNTKYEKSLVNAFIEKEMQVILTSEMCYKINNNFLFYENTINFYLQNKYIPIFTKKRLKIIKQIIKEKSKIFSKKI